MSDDTKTKYLVTDNRGEFVIEVPKTGWKITFGYVNPAIPDGGVRGAQGHCLRVYEGKDLRAVFGNVSAIRDLAIPMARKVEKQTGSASWSHDSVGNFERSEKVEVDVGAFVLEAPGDVDF